MSFQIAAANFLDHLLFASCLIILFASIVLSFKTRFVQFRLLKPTFRLIMSFFDKDRLKYDEKHAIPAHKALFTAMSTTIGVSTIVGPIIAMHLGGPGALIGFILSTIFGCAANFVEVTLAVSYRKRLADGSIMGGPMQYLKDAFSPFLAKLYAVFALILMIAWSSAQANQLASVLNLPMLEEYRVPIFITGVVTAFGVMAVVLGGIKRLGNFSEKLVPIMFIVYVGAALWIIGSNISRLPDAISLVFSSAFSPYTFANGVVVGGLVQSLRWGIFRGLQSNEAGIGTQTIPHSMTQNEIPVNQGMLSMVATYSAGFICIISGLVALLTNTWQDTNLPLGICMVAESFRQSFSNFGIAIVMISAVLFAFGTILGNCYNGSQCYGFLSKNKNIKWYYVITAIGIFLGAISDVKFIWTLTDFFLAPLAVLHIISIVILAFKRSHLFELEYKLETQASTSG